MPPEPLARAFALTGVSKSDPFSSAAGVYGLFGGSLPSRIKGRERARRDYSIQLGVERDAIGEVRAKEREPRE
jgi:hypothetical protein